MADIYVSSTSGNNNNSGLSPAAPKATIAAGISAMGGSGTLFLQRGSFFSHVFTTIPFAGFRCEAYGTGNRPIVDGGGASNTVVFDKIATFIGIEFRGNNRLMHINVLGNCLVDNCRFYQAGRGGAGQQYTIYVGNAGGGGGSFVIQNSELWDNLSDADHIWVNFCAGSTAVRALRILNNHFRAPGNGFGDHMHIYQNNARNIEFAFNTCEPVNTGKGHILCGGFTEDLSVHDNYFEGGNYVMGLETAHDYDFYNNFCVNVGPASWSGACRAAIPPAQGGRTCIMNIHDNIFYHCRNAVHSYDHSASATLTIIFEHNTVVDPTGPNARWLEFQPGSGVVQVNSIVRHNLIRNSAAGVINVSGVFADDNWFDNTPTLGSNPKTGASNLDANFFPTNPAAASLPYGARSNFTPPGQRPPPPNNTITGTSGNDVLTVPAGVPSLLNGLGGDDTFVFGPGCGASEVAWFSRLSGEQDKIDVSAFGWTTFAEFQNAVDLEVVPGGTYTDVPWDVLIIHFNDDDQVWLNGVSNILENEVILASVPSTFHFSNTGSDSVGDGSETSPFATIGKANSVSKAGDTLRFRRGDTFGDATLVLREGITVEAYGVGDRPVFNFSGTAGSACISANEIDTFTLRGLELGDTPNYLIRMETVGGPVLIEDCVFQGYGSSILSPGVGIHADTPCGFLGTMEVGECAFSQGSGGPHIFGPFSNLHVHDSTFATPGTYHIHLLGGSSTLVEFNAFSGASDGAVYVEPGDTVGQNVVVRHNEFADALFGVSAIAGGTGAQVYYNTFEDIGAQGAHWFTVQSDVGSLGTIVSTIYGNVYKNCERVLFSYTPPPTRTYQINFSDNVICVAGSDAWLDLDASTFTGTFQNNIFKDCVQGVFGCNATVSSFNFSGNWFENTPTSIARCVGAPVTDATAKTGDASLDGDCCPSGAAAGYGPDTCTIQHEIIGAVQAQIAHVTGILKILGDEPVASNDSLISFKPQGVEPASSTCSFDLRNNHPILVFSGTADQEAVFTGVMPNHYDGGGITVELLVGFTSATSGNSRWQVDFERITSGSQDIDSDSFTGSPKAASLSAPGTAGVFTWISVAFLNSEIDGIQAGDAFRIKVRRDADGTSGTDDITTTAELRAVKIKET